MAYKIEKDDIEISDDPSKLDVTLIHNYLSKKSYWAQNIPIDVLKRSIENSLCFGVYNTKEQVGFARVITDKATFAYLADVFIIEEYRGRGLSKFLVESIHSHPGLQGLRRWMLATRDAHELYSRFGWTPLPNPEWMMQRHQPDIYKG
jgi:GNAT superfamily N-acetyltransferase